MNFSKIFIERPIMTTLVMFTFVLFGIIAYNLLPVNDLPNVDFPTIMVNASLPGANADTMASAVATPLERQFATIAGLNSMTSSSALGLTQITLQFDLSRDMDGAALDVQAAITAALRLLPPQMLIPPTFFKVNPADQPVIYLAISSDTLPMYKVDEYAEVLIGQRISRVNGVAQVQVNGPQIFAVHVQVDPRKLASFGVGLNEVATAINAGNVNMPTGALYGKYQSYSVQANGQLYNADEFKNLIVTYRNGSPIKLSDLGQVIDSVQTDKVSGWFNRTNAVILAVRRQPGTNTIEVVNNIKKLIPTFNTQIPKSVKLDVLYDRSQSIKESVADVQMTLLITIGLVIFVIYLFLGNLSATFIPSVTLPIALIGTFAAMYLFKFSINNLTLMALSLSVGFVVDDAIVVLENIVRHVEIGLEPYEAALIGAKEIGFTIISMTLSLVAVFIPVLLMQGIIGKLFNEFAITISIAILISGIISLTLTPMLCSRVLTKQQHKASGLAFLFDKLFKYITQFYKASLKLALSNKAIILISFFSLTIFTAMAFWVIPKGFLPNEDTGEIIALTQAPQGISFQAMIDHHRALTDIILGDPNVESVMSSVGVSNVSASTGASPNLTLNSGRLLIVLKDKSKRKLNADSIIHELAPKLEQVTGIQVYLQNPPTITIGGQVTKGLYQYSISSPKLDELYNVTKALLAKLELNPKLKDVNSDLQVDNPQVFVNVDRDECSRLGISMFQVEEALGNAYATKQVSTIYSDVNEYWVILEVEPRYYRNPSNLEMIYIKSSTGIMIPLLSVAKISQGVGPLLINHVGQFPSVTISFNLPKGVSLGEAVASIKADAKGVVPKSVSTNFQGMAQAFEDSSGNLWTLMAIAIIVIYIVLGILYESFIHPITILTGLPSAALGALVVLILFGRDLDIYGFLGLIMLIGIVKKNAIMMIDFAVEAQRTEGKPAEVAIYQACITRFRPIMMTTLAALMGSIPIAFGFGAGSESRQPLGLTVLGGLAFSQIVTLYITPVFYVLFSRIQSKLNKQMHFNVPDTGLQFLN